MNEKNEPLMFIDTVQQLNLKENNTNYKKSTKNNDELKEKINKLVRFYTKSRKIIVELKTTNGKYIGSLFNFKEDIIYFKEQENVYHFKMQDIVNIKILEV